MHVADGSAYVERPKVDIDIESDEPVLSILMDEKAKSIDLIRKRDALNISLRPQFEDVDLSLLSAIHIRYLSGSSDCFFPSLINPRAWEKRLST